MSSVDAIKDKIDDYTDTIYAIVGFINFYRFDPSRKTIRDDVLVFQGIRLSFDVQDETDETKTIAKEVTPDLLVHGPGQVAIVGEVKKSFPADEEHWWDDFRQLLSYDNDLKGWPNEKGVVPTHDIVLLIHQSRAMAVRRFRQNNATKMPFRHPFVMIEFNRSDERQPYIFFRTVDGSLSVPAVDRQLQDGVPVPMQILLKVYSTVAFYDSEPPLPYMLNMIWTHALLPEVEDRRPGALAKLRRNQKIDVHVTVSEITHALSEAFSYRQLNREFVERQPELPKREWVENACQHLIASGEATRVNKSEDELVVSFRRYEDTLDHFVQSCAASMQPDPQLRLFEDETSVVAKGGLGQATSVEASALEPVANDGRAAYTPTSPPLDAASGDR